MLGPVVPKRVAIYDATEAVGGVDESMTTEATALSRIYADY